MKAADVVVGRTYRCKQRPRGPSHWLYVIVTGKASPAARGDRRAGYHVVGAVDGVPLPRARTAKELFSTEHAKDGPRNSGDVLEMLRSHAAEKRDEARARCSALVSAIADHGKAQRRIATDERFPRGERGDATKAWAYAEVMLGILTGKVAVGHRIGEG